MFKRVLLVLALVVIVGGIARGGGDADPPDPVKWPNGSDPFYIYCMTPGWPDGRCCTAYGLRCYFPTP